MSDREQLLKEAERLRKRLMSLHRCGATTTGGRYRGMPCDRTILTGTSFCVYHGGKSAREWASRIAEVIADPVAKENLSKCTYRDDVWYLPIEDALRVSADLSREEHELFRRLWDDANGIGADRSKARSAADLADMARLLAVR